MAEQTTQRALERWLQMSGDAQQFDPDSEEGPALQSALNAIVSRTQAPDVKLKLALDILSRGAEKGDPYAAQAYKDLYDLTPGGVGSAFMRGLSSGLSGDPNAWGAAKYLGQGENRVSLPTEQTGWAPYAGMAGSALGFMAPIVATGGAGLLGRLGWGAASKLGGKTALGLLAGEVGARSGLQHYADTTAETNALRQGRQEAGWTGPDATPMTTRERLESAATSGALNALSVPAGSAATWIARGLPGAAGRFFQAGADATFLDPRGKMWALAQKAPGAIGNVGANLPAMQHDYDVMTTQRERRLYGETPPLASMAPMLALGLIGKPEAASIYARSNAPTARFGMKGPSFWQKLRGDMPQPMPSHQPTPQAGPQRERLGVPPEELADLYLGEGELAARATPEADLYGAAQARLAEVVPTRQQLVEASIRKALLPESQQLEVEFAPDEIGKLLADISRAKQLGTLREEGQFLVERPNVGVVQMRGNELLGTRRRGVLPTGQKVVLPPNMEPVMTDTGMGIRASVTMPEGQPAVTGVLYGHDPQTGSAVILTDDGRVLRAPTSRVPEWQKYTTDAEAAREAAREEKAQRRKKGVAPKPRTELPGFTPKEGQRRIQSMADRAKANLGVWDVGLDEPQMAVSHDMSTGVTGPTAVPTRTPDAELEALVQELLRSIRKPS